MDEVAMLRLTTPATVTGFSTSNVWRADTNTKILFTGRFFVIKVPKRTVHVPVSNVANFELMDKTKMIGPDAGKAILSSKRS